MGRYKMIGISVAHRGIVKQNPREASGTRVCTQVLDLNDWHHLWIFMETLKICTVEFSMEVV